MEVPEVGSGQVLCRTILLSVDPANRAWMAGRTYREQLGENEVMSGFTLSEVVDSGDTTLARGTIVAGDGGWQEYAVLPAAGLRAVDVRGPLTLHMSALGITGLTAYFGMLEVGRPAEGETVVVSAAAGATGVSLGNSPASRVRGWSVSLAPTRRTKSLVDTLGFDAAVNYRSDTFRKGSPRTVSERCRRVLRQCRRFHARNDAAPDERARSHRLLWCGVAVRHL